MAFDSSNVPKKAAWRTSTSKKLPKMSAVVKTNYRPDGTNLRYVECVTVFVALNDSGRGRFTCFSDGMVSHALANSLAFNGVVEDFCKGLHARLPDMLPDLSSTRSPAAGTTFSTVLDPDMFDPRPLDTLTVSCLSHEVQMSKLAETAAV